ncbi:MAG TPA: sigma-70 family RNA polymerase sigma factor [Bryobacteraceae bacterium]|jgi:RNA polymerase sigma-70 factor (ECF subfamily)
MMGASVGIQIHKFGRTPDGVRQPDVEDQVRQNEIEQQRKLKLFEECILPHLNAAYNLARWLTRNEHDAQDVVQEAYLRAFRFFDSFKGGDGKAWLLAVVRNTCSTWRRREMRGSNDEPFDEAAHSADLQPVSQEQKMVDSARRGVLRNCIEKLPADFREVIVMREIEGMSYQEIAEAATLPVGTVMSRLSRARKRLEDCVSGSKLRTIVGQGR